MHTGGARTWKHRTLHSDSNLQSQRRPTINGSQQNYNNLERASYSLALPYDLILGHALDTEQSPRDRLQLVRLECRRIREE
jgi:hypothetical protein